MVRVELNHDGVRELLRSPEMMAVCESHAKRAVSKLGAGYEVSTHTGKGRVNASVAAVSPEARRENSESNTVIKAVMGS